MERVDEMTETNSEVYKYLLNVVKEYTPSYIPDPRIRYNKGLIIDSIDIVH